MRKIGVVAVAEFLAAVRTKAFLVGLMVMPLLMVGGGLLQHVLENRVDTSARRFAVIDRTGVLFDGLSARAAERNALLGSQGGFKGAGAPFVPSKVELAGRGQEEVLLELSDRVRGGELFAFVEIPAGVLDTGPTTAPWPAATVVPAPVPTAAASAPSQGAQESASAAGSTIHYYSDHPTYFDLHQWVERAVNDEIQAARFRAAGLDVALIQRLGAPVRSEHRGLLARGPGGVARPAEKVDELESFLVPMILMLLLFMPVMIGGPPLLQAVIEEKMSRISEVLLGSVSPFELMMGKLLGGAAVSFLLALIYLAVGMGVLEYMGLRSLVPISMLPFYFVFLTLAVLLFGSIYLAVGSACSEPRDAQSLMMPIVLLTVLPAMTLTPIIKAPTSAFSVGMSLFPPATPFVMLMRLALHPPPPWWQVVLSIVLTAATVIGCVWAASRIFRVGLLSQGKAPSYGKLLRWIFAK